MPWSTGCCNLCSANAQGTCLLQLLSEITTTCQKWEKDMHTQVDNYGLLVDRLQVAIVSVAQSPAARSQPGAWPAHKLSTSCFCCCRCWSLQAYFHTVQKYTLCTQQNSAVLLLYRLQACLRLSSGFSEPQWVSDFVWDSRLLGCQFVQQVRL